MRKLIFITFILLLSSCKSEFKYFIKDKNGKYYVCNFYNKTGDGCIMFNDKPGYDNTPGIPTKLCGWYEIKKLK